MVAIWATCAVVIVAVGAELIHAARSRRVAHLAFGPAGHPSAWARAAPLLRVTSLAALCWGMVTLMSIAPKVHKGDQIEPGDYKHLVIVLDVSPSMRLKDAGPTGEQSRTHRVRDVLESIFERTPIQQFRTSVVATYNGAEPVVVETTDADVIRNILNDLPLYAAFKTGKTDLFAGLTKAAEIARPWQPRSTTVLLLSDGDTVPATGTPKMPASVAHVLVVGVGDPQVGKFIDGHQSRQDSSTLRQVAIRLGGTYHNANRQHVGTELARSVIQVTETSPLKRLTLREYALIACAVGGTVLALLPLLLHLAGTRYRPGVRVIAGSNGSEPSIEETRTRKPITRQARQRRELTPAK